MLRRAALLAIVVGGCAPATGIMVEVAGPGGTSSTQAGITRLEFIVAHQSWCERWVSDATASHTSKSVAGRDLAKQPYDFLITPTHQTDLSQPVYVAALAWSDDGRLLGEAAFGAHPYKHGAVDKYRARVALFADATAGAPKYVDADGGCVCVPGEPWIGNGQGTGCDPRVITSFDRLIDTAGCELPPNAPLPDPVCDGQKYRDEPTDRALPCWADDGSGACRVTTRNCADHDGVAWTEECATGSGDTMLPAGSTLCARYLACEQQACGDVIGCFRQGFQQNANITCTLRIDPTTQPGDKIVPCASGPWQATLPLGTTGGSDCQTAVLEGVEQPPFRIGLAVAGQTEAQPLSSACPATLQVDAIDAPYPMAVPTTKALDLVSGEHLVHVTIKVALECGGEPSLVCSSG